jgi:quinol monooxygenase YgiN
MTFSHHSLSRYKSKAAMGAHGSSKEFKAFQKKMAEEGLIAAPMQLKFVKAVGGFARL